VIANDNIRAKLGILSKKEVKDIESMPAFVERLRYRPLSSLRKTRSS